MIVGVPCKWMFLGSVAAAALLATSGGCGGDDETGGGGTMPTSTTTTTTYSYTTTSTTTTGAGGSGGTEINQQICDDAWAHYTDDCGFGQGGAGGGEPQPTCDSYETCRSYCILDATCNDIQVGDVNYVSCIGCCDEYNPGC